MAHGKLEIEHAFRSESQLMNPNDHEMTRSELMAANERLQQELNQRMQAEAEIKEASHRKDDFLAMLGHELRNPLGPILNGAVLIPLVDGDRDKLREISEMIERQVQHVTRIVDDLLDISRISRGKIALLREPLNLNEVVQNAIADVQEVLEREDLTVRMEVPADPIWINGDPIRITQILGNLLHNARKFTNAGGEVSVSLQYLPALDEALLKISDTGIGIDAELLEHLFEPFAPADHAPDGSRRGLGLGLVLVKGLIELHGGSIAASSSGPGHGAQFTIRLPAIPKLQPTAQEPEPSPPPESNCSPEPQCLRILVIEDQRDTVQTMQKLLSTLGHDVHVALDGEEGIRLAREVRPRVIFSDIGLPGMTGYDVAKTLRADFTKETVAMVAITGYGRDDDMRRALGAGFDRHLVKPIRFADLEQLLNSL